MKSSPTPTAGPVGSTEATEATGGPPFCLRTGTPHRPGSALAPPARCGAGGSLLHGCDAGTRVGPTRLHGACAVDLRCGRAPGTSATGGEGLSSSLEFEMEGKGSWKGVCRATGGSLGGSQCQCLTSFGGGASVALFSFNKASMGLSSKRFFAGVLPCDSLFMLVNPPV